MPNLLAQQPLENEASPGLPAQLRLIEQQPSATQPPQETGPPEEAKLPEEPCPTESAIPPLSSIRLDLRPPPPGKFKNVDVPPECPLVGQDKYVPRAWAPTTYAWKAPGLYHYPLYFEEPALERYGHTWGAATQPLVSTAHFFATFPVLPYKMGLHPPLEHFYPLGYFEPGSYAPMMIPPVPISLQAALAEAGTVTGAIFLVP